MSTLIAPALTVACQCHNFKDPSVQLYGGSMFRASCSRKQRGFCCSNLLLLLLLLLILQSIADAADAAFCTMPAPRSSGHSTSSASSAPVDMSMCGHWHSCAVSCHARAGSWTVTAAALHRNPSSSCLMAPAVRFSH